MQAKKGEQIDARPSRPGFLFTPFRGACLKILIALESTALGHCLSLRAADDDVIEQAYVHERQDLLEPGGDGAVRRRWVRCS